MSTNEQITQDFAATVKALPNGKFAHTVTCNGEVVDTRTSARKYAVIHIQRWAHIGSEGEYGTADDYAVRYGSKIKAQGSKIEYGFCHRNVIIEDA